MKAPLMLAAVLLAVVSARGADPDFSVSLQSVSTNVVGSETNLTYIYKVVNTSPPGIDYDLGTLGIGAGTNVEGGLQSAEGGYHSDIGTWTKTVGPVNTIFSYSPGGEPVYATGNTNDDYGLFVLWTKQTDQGLIDFNAVSSGAGPFPTTRQCLGPKKNHLPASVSSVSLAGQTLSLSFSVTNPPDFCSIQRTFSLTESWTNVATLYVTTSSTNWFETLSNEWPNVFYRIATP
jgi:hypothetical protein